MLWILICFIVVVDAGNSFTPAEELAITIAKLKEWLIVDESPIYTFELNQFWELFSNVPTTKQESNDLKKGVEEWIRKQQKPKNIEIDFAEFAKLDENYLGLTLSKMMTLLHVLTTEPTAEKNTEFRNECNNVQRDADTQRTELKGLAETSIQDAKESMDRALLLRAAKRHILRWSCAHLVTLMCHDAALFKSSHFTTLINMFIDAENDIIQNWSGENFNKDIQRKINEFATSGKASNEHEYLANIKAHLDDKYYWLRFRVSVTTPTIVFPGSITVSTQVPGSGPTNLAIRYVQLDDTAPTATSEKISDPKRIPRTNKWELKAAAKDQLVKGAGVTGFVGSVADGAKALAKVKSLQDKIGLGLKKVLHIGGALLKHLGPIVSAALTLASFYEEDGTTAIVDELREGFGEMHNRFNEIENQLQQTQKVLTSEIEFRTQFAAYQIAIKDKVHMLNMQLDLATANPRYKPHFDAAVAMCNANGTNAMPPLALLLLMKRSYLGNQFSPLLQTVKKWAGRDRQKLQAALALFLADVTQLVALHQACLSYRYASASVAADAQVHLQESMKATAILYEIRMKILKMNYHATYEWPDAMVEDVKKLMKQHEKDTQKEVVAAIKGMLNQVYYWNNFLIFTLQGGYAFKKGLAKFNPDYARLIQVDGGNIAHIIWTAKDGGAIKYDKGDPSTQDECLAEITEEKVNEVFDSTAGVQAVFAVQGEWYHDMTTLNRYECNKAERKTSEYQAYDQDMDDRLTRFHRTCEGKGKCSEKKEDYVTYMVNTGQGYSNP